MLCKHNDTLFASLNLAQELILPKLRIEPLCFKEGFNERCPFLWGSHQQFVHSFLFR